MKALCVGDIHIADRPPSMRTETYEDDIIDKLNQTIYLAEENEVQVVVWAGDVFHVKNPRNVSHRLVQRIQRIVWQYRRPLFITPGNHDLSNDRMDSLSKQPLGTLAGVDNVLLAPEEVVWTVGGVPYLNDWNRLPDYIKELPKTVELLVLHAPIMPPDSGDLPYDFIGADTLAGILPDNIKAVFYGHPHDCHGIYSVDGIDFCNLGAVSRGSLHEVDLRRKPAVAVYERGYGFTRLDLKVKPVSEVFRMVEVTEARQGEARFNSFLDSIGSASLDVFSIEAVLADVDSMSISVATKTLIKELIEEAAAK